jgi:ATP-dependent Lon protease
MPWGKFNDVKIDLAEAEKTLDLEHYGLMKVKERILEYLAVHKRMSKIKGPILCLVGPPGVGKTSLAKSIANATNREFVRFALGGVRDEAEIRGHRRTYLGAMPGKIIQYLKKAKSSNPVFLLDEIDKLGMDFRGDPASSLLEVLDPEQNKNFIDHYLEVEYDLSNVMFIATANSLNIPAALLDRMEVIKVHSYTEEEKLEIATHHLVPKQIKEHGLSAKEWSISQEALLKLIRLYTREAGVRNLERELANLTRKAVKKILSTTTKSVKINEANLKKYAGIEKFTYGEIEHADLTGVTTGLAYTEVGGVILSIEAVCLPGKGNIKTTGKLGEVMQESAQAAFSYFKSKCLEVGITQTYYQEKDIHLHVPEGATNKDGPSAGIAMFTSIVSIMTGVAVKKTVAMTGEITLRGRVLAIGGLKEKLLAALRSGIKTVIIPKDNMKDLEEMPINVKKQLKIIPVSLASEVLAIALVRTPVSLVSGEEKFLPKTLPTPLPKTIVPSENLLTC